MAATAFTINGKPANVEAEPDTPLLWVVREQLKLTGTKFGCIHARRHWPRRRSTRGNATDQVQRLGQHRSRQYNQHRLSGG